MVLEVRNSRKEAESKLLPTHCLGKQKDKDTALKSRTKPSSWPSDWFCNIPNITVGLKPQNANMRPDSRMEIQGGRWRRKFLNMEG